MRKGWGEMARVLVADDDVVSLTLAATILELEAHEVVTVSDGVGALRRAIDERPEAIVLGDLSPEMDALTVLRYLRHDLRTSAIPVLVVSEDASPTDVAGAINGGAQGYLVKPFRAKDFVAEIHRIMVDGVNGHRAETPRAAHR